MKTGILCAGVFTFLSLLLHASAADAGKVTATYAFAAPRVERAGDYARVSVKGCPRVHRVGQPELPFLTGKILLPAGAGVAAVAAEPLDAVETATVAFPVTFGRTPVPVGKPGHAAVARAALDQPDRVTYAADAPYPASRVELLSVQQMHGYSIAIVRIFPVQYQPASGRLLSCRNLRVNVFLAASVATVQTGAATVPARRPPTTRAAEVATFVDNPEQVAISATRTPASQAVSATACDYLLVTTAALTNAFLPLLEQKMAAGLSVKVATVESIVAGYAGVDDAARVRAFITYAYTNWNIRYVLLGGDTATVPYRQAYGFVDTADATLPCDLYFACLDGSWNSDGDANWGEPTDGEGGGDVDLLAEVYVGRAPVDTAAEVTNFVGKTVYFEQNRHANADSVRFLAEYLGNYSGVQAQGGDGLDRLLSSFSAYEVSWLDDRPSAAATWTADDSVNALNLPPQLVLHGGHASQTYALRMAVSDIDRLTNRAPFLLNSIGCDCGAFDYADCFAEELVKRSASGAFAVIMNSRYGWFNADAEWMFSGEFVARFCEALLVRQNRSIGVANQLAKHDMLGAVETTGAMVYRWCYFDITLFGDPHTMIQAGDDLQVSPLSGLDASGPVGGGFTPSSQAYALTNAGNATLTWTAAATSGLVGLSAGGGTLAAGQGTTVVIALDAGTASLPPGFYTDVVAFSNAVSHARRQRGVTLQVGQNDSFTELFASPKTNDLAYQSIVFRPDGSPGFYRATREAVSSFPVDPTGGAYLALGDDGSLPCTLSGGAQVSLYGVPYTDIYVGANGYVTFGSADTAYAESLSAHFAMPRVAAMFRDLYPQSTTVSWKQLPDRVAVTYANVPEYNSTLVNSFQIELFLDGVIRITYLNVGSLFGLAGLSSGAGVPANFRESDLSAYGWDRALDVVPRDSFVSSGYLGGPFAPSNRTYRVSNAGTNALTWAVVHTADWVTASVAGGTLAPGAAANVLVSLTAAAALLPSGSQTQLLVFSNTVSGDTLPRDVILNVREIPGAIDVSDSIWPGDDRRVPFAGVVVGQSRTACVTVTNRDESHDLVLSSIRVQGTTAARAADATCFGVDMLGQRLVSFQTSDPGSLTTIAGTGSDLIVGVDFLNGDFSRLFAMDADVGALLVIDTTTGAQSLIGLTTPRTGHSWTGQAGDPDGTLYACSSDGLESDLYTIDTASGVATPVGTITGAPVVIDIAVNAAGEMYGVDIGGDNLVRIDKATGVGTVVGSLGIDANYAQGLDCDEVNNVLYWAAYSTLSELRVIDTASGASTLVAAFPALTELNLAVANGGVGVFALSGLPALPHRVTPGAAVSFDVTYQPVAPGSNTASVVIASNDADEPQVAVALTGEGIADYLEIWPSNGFSAGGHPGGPFTPATQSYAISNAGVDSAGWAIAALPSWLTVTPDSGWLAAGACETVQAAFGPAAATLPAGTYGSALVFSNFTTHAVQARTVQLAVFTTPVVQVAPAHLTVSNRLGQAQHMRLQIGNAAWADAALTFTLGVMQTSAIPGVAAARLPVACDFAQSTTSAAHRADELLVRFSPAATGVSRTQALASAGGGTVTREFKLVPGLAVVKLVPGTTLATALGRFNRTAGVLYAQPNYLQHAFRTPDDPLFAELWGLHNTGQTGGVPDVDIDAPEAWEQSVGTNASIVAVIDTGIDYTHEDLAANIWTNPGEIAGNGIDDDGNGYIDDIHGYDFCNGDADPMDDHDHGTHVAGTVGAVGDNGVGVAGVCWRVKIMALKFISSANSGFTSDAISCIEYAVRMGAQVLNNSWGGAPYEQALKDAIDAAGAANVLFVAAAGNDYGGNNDTTPAYPASYDSDTILSVMSVNASGALSSFSNFGLLSVDLAAPGSAIVSCRRGGGTITFSGTSMATPHVAGACALLLSRNAGLSVQQIKHTLLATTDASLPGLCVSGGLLNLAQALAAVPTWLQIWPTAGGSLAPGAWSNATVTVAAGALAAGSYYGGITVTSNDRETPLVQVPVTMVVVPDMPGAPPWTWLWQFDLPTDGSADLLDTDGDGMVNRDEWVADTVPTNARSRLTMERVAPEEATNGFRVRWQSVASRLYWLESCEALTNPLFFSPFVSNLMGQSGSTEALDARPAAAGGARYYRVGVQGTP